MMCWVSEYAVVSRVCDWHGGRARAQAKVSPAATPQPTPPGAAARRPRRLLSSFTLLVLPPAQRRATQETRF